LELRAFASLLFNFPIYKIGPVGVYLVKHEYPTKRRPLKKITITTFFVVVALACALLYWRHVQMGKFDDGFRQHLPGVWLRQEPDMRCTNTVAADGSFVELSWFSHPDRTNTYRRTGTWFVKDGSLNEIVKTSTNPVETTPHTGDGWIVHADAREFTVRWSNGHKTVWQKMIP